MVAKVEIACDDEICLRKKKSELDVVVGDVESDVWCGVGGDKGGWGRGRSGYRLGPIPPSATASGDCKNCLFWSIRHCRKLYFESLFLDASLLFYSLAALPSALVNCPERLYILFAFW